MEDNTQDEILKLYGSLFGKLLESPRFQQFFELNFTLTKTIDEETKEITYNLIESPSDVVAEKLKALMTKSAMEQQGKIVTASPQDLKEIEKKIIL